MAAAQRTAASQVISETAKQEDGPHKGSTSAQMQSEVGRTRNFEQAARELGSKLMNAPETDAAYIKSREARALGKAQPPAGSISADAPHLAARNEGAIKSSTNSAADPAQQSHQDRVANFEEASEQVGNKMAQEPAHVTKEDGDLLHSRETHAFGATSKGGVASQAQSLAADNEKLGTA
ncbi:hypothetical protein LTR36_002623 [Oleoguttula mirabilis]|uniref:SMP domain-containing protein n=1 Tax=Oleoguttula mirabilis TaxID=1507867 RepID=A0AAV9JJR6_9PEZI|nr:hypothetical protein LTR36_002623 [Oleoguttula mirabilis]